MFEVLKNNVEEEIYIAKHDYNIPTLLLSGLDNPKENVSKIKKLIKG